VTNLKHEARNSTHETNPNVPSPNVSNIGTSSLKFVSCFVLRISRFVFLLIAGGCTNTIFPPRAGGPTTSIYVADYGRHSSLLLPTDRSDRAIVEYAFGDYEWFARGDTRWWVAVVAMLHSPQATLGRRYVAPPGPGNVGDEDIEFAKLLGANTLLRFDCPADRVEELGGRLDRRFKAEAGNDATVFSAYSDLWHVRDPAPYCAAHNCNHVSVAWLESLGCRVRGLHAFSRFRIASARDYELPQPPP
jgi:hypothetical protein